MVSVPDPKLCDPQSLRTNNIGWRLLCVDLDFTVYLSALGPFFYCLDLSHKGELSGLNSSQSFIAPPLPLLMTSFPKLSYPSTVSSWSLDKIFHFSLRVNHKYGKFL